MERPAVSLFFKDSARPDAASVRRFADENREFGVSNPQRETGRRYFSLELLTCGFTFDLEGLAPGRAHHPVACPYRFGAVPSLHAAEALALVPGPHLAGGLRMVPVLRLQLWLASRLCLLPDIAAIGWLPSRSVTGVEHFRQRAVDWLRGGSEPDFFRPPPP